MLLIDRLRTAEKNNFVLAKPHRPGVLPEIFVTDAESASLAAWAVNDCGEEWTSALPTVVVLKPQFFWLEWSTSRGVQIGALVDEGCHDAGDWAVNTRPSDLGPVGFEATVEFWAYDPRDAAPAVVRQPDHAVLWTYPGDYDVLGGILRVEGETTYGERTWLDDAAEVVKGMIVLLNAPRFLSITAVQPSSTDRAAARRRGVAPPLPHSVLTFAEPDVGSEATAA